MVEVRSDQLKRAASKIRDDAKDLHVSGQPGIGKTTFLDYLIAELETDFEIEKTSVRLHHEPADLERTILHSLRRIAPEVDSKANQLTGISAGVGPVSGGGTVDDRARDIHKIEDLTRNWSGNPLIFCIDDVHKLSSDETTVREVIAEFASALGENVYLITSGRVSVSALEEVEEIHLNLFTLKETEKYLNAVFESIEEDQVRNIHNAVEGHPLFLGIVCESSDDESEFELSEEKFLNNIEQRYIDSLPKEDEEFLRNVAVLPELDERTVSGVFHDYSPTAVDRKLRKLNRRVILEEVNRTDRGDRLYKIHERFRNFLVRKQQETTEIHKRAFEYHIQVVLQALLSENEDSWEETLPHVFYAKYHLKEFEEGDNPKSFLNALDEIDLDYPERGIFVIFSGLMAYPTRATELFRKEQIQFAEWVRSLGAEEPFAELSIQLVDWGISQFEDEPKELNEIKVEGDLKEAAVESKPFTNLDLSEEHTERLENATYKLAESFFIEEPHRRMEKREQARKHIQFYGISTELLRELRRKIKAILLDSNIGEEIEQILKDYESSIGEEFEGALNSSIDFYQIRDQSIRFGYSLFDSVHEDLLLDSGVIEEIAVEGGQILERGENPAFALFWYSVVIAYFRNHPVSPEGMRELQDRFGQILEERAEFEKNLEKPLIKASEVEEQFVHELEDSNQ